MARSDIFETRTRVMAPTPSVVKYYGQNFRSPLLECKTKLFVKPEQSKTMSCVLLVCVCVCVFVLCVRVCLCVCCLQVCTSIDLA